MNEVWRPRPDPAIHDPVRPGLRPHVHEPNRLWPWVFSQDKVWVDYWGNEHEIALMAGDYIANVIEFCRQRALRIALLVIGAAAGRPLGFDELQIPGSEGEDGSLLLSHARIADEWLETTVLMRVLRAELARRQRSGGPDAA